MSGIEIGINIVILVRCMPNINTGYGHGGPLFSSSHSHLQ